MFSKKKSLLLKCGLLWLSMIGINVSFALPAKDYLSSDHPLSEAEIEKIQIDEKNGDNPLTLAVDTQTYTYVRCYYKTEDNLLNPATNYIWASKENHSCYTGDVFGLSRCFKLEGYWYKSGVQYWKNMFYTEVSQDKLKEVCEASLKARGKNKPVEMIMAANNALSLNYAIWTNNLDTSPTQTLDRIIVLGDSLSDNQNMYNASQWRLPQRESWFLGHFTNYKVWVEYLSEKAHLPLYNWAVGGAGTEEVNPSTGALPDPLIPIVPKQFYLPGMVEQANSWQQYMKVAKNYQVEKSLFFIMIGGNDIISYGTPLQNMLAAQEKTLETLLSAGVKHIIVMNLVDVSKAPVFEFPDKKGKQAEVAAKVMQYNAGLQELVYRLSIKYAAQSVHIRLFDTAALLEKLLAHPEQYGITNTTQSCLAIDTVSSFNYMQKQKPRAACQNPEEYVFWDTLHPTTRIHKILADALFEVIKSV